MKRFIKITREKIMFKVLNEVCQPTRATKYSAMVDLYANDDVVIGAGAEAHRPDDGFCCNRYKSKDS